jgi:hypothetical protein
MATKQFENYADLITFTRASTATYLDSDGLLKSATTNTPRIEYDADGNRLGLLIEEARTNLISWSEALNTGWSIGSATVTADQTVAPDGNTTADEVNLSLGGFVYFTSTVTASTTYTASWYIKAGTATAWIYAFFDGTAGSFINRVQYDITDGEDVGNGWYRFNVSVTTPAGCTSLRVYPVREQIGVGSVAGVVGTSFIWGAQLEAGSFPTSYIPTAGATATRAADVASIPTSAFGYNQKAGTVVCEFEFSNYVGGNRRLFSLNTNIQNRMDGLLVGNGQLQQFVVDGGSTQVNPNTTNGITNNEPSKAAVVYALNDFASVLDDGAIKTDTLGTVPSVSTLSIGNSPIGNWTNGYLKSIQYYPRRLTNAQLQELTA